MKRRSNATLGSLVVVVTLASLPALGQVNQSGFPVTLTGAGQVRFSSTALGDVDGDELPDVVVGTVDGWVFAYDGLGTPLWSVDTGSMGIESKAAIADLDGDGSAEVVVSLGSPSTIQADGGVVVLSHLGVQECRFDTNDTNSDSFQDGVFSSPAIADLDPTTDDLEIVFATWDRRVVVMRPDCSLVWDVDTFDTAWSSPAVGDLDGDGDLDVVVGTPIDSVVPPFQDGGLVRALDGATGAELPGFPIQTDESVDSSPALGDIDGDGDLEIVVGTGYCWADPACAPGGDVHPGVGEEINAWHHDGTPVAGWPVSVVATTYTFASPALADLDEDGVLDVVVNSHNGTNTEIGMIYALDGGGNPLPGWPTQPTIPIDGMGNTRNTSTRASPIVADVTGDGHLEVILPCRFEIVVFDRFGTQLTRDSLPPDPGAWTLAATFSIAGAAGVADLDGDGDLELAVGGGTTPPDGPPGAIYAWDLDASAAGPLPWPVFRRDERSTASAGSILFADGFESGNTTGWSSSS